MLSKETCAFFLISIKVNLDLQDIEGKTALHKACFNGNTEIVRKLVRYGANTELKDYVQEKPIDIARENRFNNVEKQLVMFV